MSTQASGFGPLQKAAVAKACSLASLNLEAPERFARGDARIVQESLETMKAVLDFAFHTEPDAVAALSLYLGDDEPESSRKQTRGTGSNKRKRGGSSSSGSDGNRLGVSELDELTVEDVNAEQIWSQIEIKNEKMTAFLDAAMVDVNGTNEQTMLEEEEDEEEVLDEVDKKKRKTSIRGLGEGEEEDEEEDDLQAMPDEKVIHSLKDLTDAELKSLGIDPSLRDELEAMGDEEEEGDSFGDEEEEDEGQFGYAGASDLSDDDEMRGKVVLEPLRTEAEQRKRQAQVMAEERRMAMRQAKLRRMMGVDEEDDSDGFDEEDGEEDDEDDEDDDEDYGGDETMEVDEEEGSESDSDEDSQTSSRRQRLSTMLDDLDERGSNAANGKKWKVHPALDDDFFSIDQFNKDTDDYGDEGINLGDDVDLFKRIEDEGDDENDKPILYTDFFAPPPSGPTAEEVVKPSGRQPSVRFDDQVSVRRIKARKKSGMDLTPEMMAALQTEMEEEECEETSEKEGEEMDEEDEGNEEGEEGEEEEEGDEEEQEDEAEEDKEEGDGDVSEEEQETAHRVAGDLFADEEEEQDVKEKQQSSHERRLEKLQAEISRLEQENVSKKDWTLMGESGSRSRPDNSLLAEPLDFENNQRAKPIVTQETTATLEDLIRKRILESQYDDVERRANVQPLDFLPSKMLELSDSKSSKSLDQVYEDEMGMGGGTSHGEKMDKQLEQDHQEIAKLYDELEYKLDALSNAHFTPKAPKATIQTIANAPTITLEESLPSSSTHASQLAPEEVYDAGRHNAAWQGERSEMSPEEKKRLQRQLRTDKKARQERIDSVKKNVEINKQAFAKDRGGRFVGKKSSRKDGKEKEEALRKLMGNKGVSVVGKGNEDKKRGKRAWGANGEQSSSSSLNASHLKL